MALTTKRAWCEASAAERDYARLFETVEAAQADGLLLYCAPVVDRKRLAAALREHVRCPVLACTTAGECVDGYGYVENGIAALTLRSPELRFNVYPIHALGEFDLTRARGLARQVHHECESAAVSANSAACGVLMIDGLSLAEERVAANLALAFAGMPIVGGSAGDGAAFERTEIFDGETFGADRAALAVIHTSLPLHVFQTQHYDAGDTRLVITAATPEKRLLHELNARPAAEAYAETIGVAVEALDAATLARNPLLFRVRDEYFVRSIQRVLDDGTLAMYSAVEAGMVTRIGRGGDLVGGLRDAFDGVERAIGKPQCILGFDCIARRAEVFAAQAQHALRTLIAGSGFFAFNTYGEQARGLHVNHTLTGVALGDSA